jgi:hypothetical protein
LFNYALNPIPATLNKEVLKDAYKGLGYERILPLKNEYVDKSQNSQVSSQRIPCIVELGSVEGPLLIP